MEQGLESSMASLLVVNGRQKSLEETSETRGVWVFSL